jgi:hypothetical protein
MIMRKIRALLLMAVPVLLLSCGDRTNRNINDTDDDTRRNMEYNRENDMDNTRDRNDLDMDRGTNQGVDRDTIGQDL